MSLSLDYRDYILDQLSLVEDVMPRKMFGGLGVFKHGVMFGILSRMDGFYLKVDDINQPDFKRSVLNRSDLIKSVT